jgi:hypothetical protein
MVIEPIRDGIHGSRGKARSRRSRVGEAWRCPARSRSTRTRHIRAGRTPTSPPAAKRQPKAAGEFTVSEGARLEGRFLKPCPPRRRGSRISRLDTRHLTGALDAARVQITGAEVDWTRLGGRCGFGQDESEPVEAAPPSPLSPRRRAGTGVGGPCLTHRDAKAARSWPGALSAPCLLRRGPRLTPWRRSPSLVVAVTRTDGHRRSPSRLLGTPRRHPAHGRRPSRPPGGA